MATGNYPTLFSPFESLFDNGLFAHNLWPKPGANTSPGVMPARMDVTETENEYQLSFDLPGIQKNDIDITCQEGILKVTAETKKEVDKSDGENIHRERFQGKYQRQISLGSNIAEKDIKASFDQGVLALNVPKQKPKLPKSTTIKIR
jgi:HSP20 family protein